VLERLVEYLQSQSLGLGYAAVFGLLLAAGFGFPLPEDVPLIAGGVLAWLASPLEEVSLSGMLSDHGFQAMVAVGLGGILIGDSVIYLAGRRIGRRVAEVWPFRTLVTPEKLEKVVRPPRKPVTMKPCSRMKTISPRWNTVCHPLQVKVLALIVWS